MPDDGRRGKRQQVARWRQVWRAAGYGPSLALPLLGASLLTLALLSLRIREHRPPSWDSQGLRLLAQHPHREPLHSTLDVFARVGSEYRGLVLAGLLVLGLVVLRRMRAALVYSRSHYPSDVVGGWCIALVWTCGFALLVSKGDRRTGHELSLVREGPRLGHRQDDEELAPGTGAIPLREE